MKKKIQEKEILEELVEEPYKFFEQVDYRKIMSLKIDAIKIDSKNEQSKERKNDATDSQAALSDAESEDAQTDVNIVYICALIIDIEAITKTSILKLRKFMPKKDYR